MPMIHPEEGSAARLVLIHRAVDYNQQGRLHILFTGFPAVITINNTNNKSIKQYRHNGDVYIVMDNCKDGVGSSVICSSAPNSYSSLLAVPVKSDNGNQSLYNHRNPPIIRCIEEWFERIGQYFRNFLQRRKKLRNLPLPDSRKSDERISRSDNDDDKSSVGRKLYDFQKSSSCDLRMDNLPFNVETYTLGQTPHSFAVDPQGHWYIIWLTIVTFAYLYNCLVIPLRNAFPYQTPDNIGKWMFWDYFMDLVYLLDVLLIKPRIKYLDDGFWIQDPELTKQHYVQKFQYKMDLLALLPLDLLYIKFGTEHSYLRLPRLLKIQTFWEFFEVLDNYTSSSYVIRVVRTLTYMLYLVHLNTCAYYAVSVYEGIGSNKWVYNGEGNAYIRCFYRATKTAACIGKNPKPSNEIEYLFMTASWLMGVFVFAILIGQIRDIIATASKTQTEYKKLVDESLEYLRRLNVPKETRDRVEQWFSFTWEQQRTLDEMKILDALPHKLKTDVAINVHFRTLCKVELFHDCDEALLRDLVLKLRPILYLPGDYICRKGEVGREMYIVKTGQVQVVEGVDGSKVLATLSEGSVFGEISLLNLAGTNRRTADVRSNGFSSLFVLKKNDLMDTIQYYPNAESILKKKAKELVRRNAVNGNRHTAADMLQSSDSDIVSTMSACKQVKRYCKRRKRKVSIINKKKKSVTAYVRKYRPQTKCRTPRLCSDSRVVFYRRRKQRRKSKKATDSANFALF